MWPVHLLLVGLVGGLKQGRFEKKDVKPEQKKEACGYESCPMTFPDVLNVHIVAHTHNDVGWLKTVNQYYYENVQYILDSVVKELWEHPHRRFIYVETYYFWKWWLRQPDLLRKPVQELVRRGQLQFAGGAWSMNDEATTHYQEIVDQFTLGLSKLKKIFGECGVPHVGWQIDPYGHSREFASLLAGMGYHGLFLGRVDYRDKMKRVKDKSLQFLWRGDDDLGNSSDIFTEVLYNKYDPPPGFCFDQGCGDSEITEFNVEERMSSFLEFVQRQSQSYATHNVLVTMGADFTYQDSRAWYNSLDKLIIYSNSRSTDEDFKIRLFYSTPECYLKAVHDSDIKYPIKQDDFFPYATDSVSYWSGFYTSRPTIKYFARQGNIYLQMAKQLFVLGGLWQNHINVLNELKSAVGILQHHDAVTGTQQQHVAHDYEMLLDEAIEASLTIPREVFSKFMHADPLTFPLRFHRCRLNESSCNVTETAERFVVSVYNPLAWKVNESIRVPVLMGDSEFIVYAPNGEEITIQLVDIPVSIIDIPTRESAASHEIVFIAYLKPLSYKNFYVQRIEKSNSKRSNKAGAADQEKHNSYYTIHMNKNRGQIAAVTLPDGSNIGFDIKICYYAAMDNHDTRKSGAYIFRPKHQAAFETALKFFRGPNGPVVREYRSISLENVASTVRIYEGLNFIENDWVIGPIDVSDKIGKEFVIKYITSIDNKGDFFTDSNGRQMIRRSLFKRTQFNDTFEEPIAANYYPVVNRIYIKDNNVKATVLTDRAEGGSSLDQGEIELMLHRRLLQDDGIGVAEALNEMAKGKGVAVRGRHRIYFSKPKNKQDNIQQKEQAIQYHLQPLVFLSDAKFLSLENWLQFQNAYTWANALPRGLHLLTLEPWEINTVLIRLENYLELEDTPYSTIEIDLNSIFKTLIVISFKETTLAANRWPKDEEIWNWGATSEFKMNFNRGDDKKAEFIGTQPDKGFNVVIKAKQIRTFIVKISMDYKNEWN